MEDLDVVTKGVSEVVNFIKARSPNSRIFSCMCSDNGSDHTCFHILWSGGGTDETSFEELWLYTLRTKPFCLKEIIPWL